MKVLLNAKERMYVRKTKTAIKFIAVVLIALKIVNLIADRYSI